ncbi:putative fad binding domain containing protein [Phaeoacremonium minimum UCRPA7]|uniref:Putative fad binding domain containing protein n=1 Tax=Phaeoacremonium minimum (strain UCR-PA7) TaxID=1286976 RepID=R8BHZ3_PHAM7|nr:putative fad binding domain containing protein [Phaeoacremonium minimum UCRPA7]EON98948.1 putative fad binding domain containing protein [Phaeoacremonium minimum UCRPA7]
MAANTPKPAYPQAECLINAGLQAQVLLPTEADYIAREESYWSNSAKLKPACIVRPRSSQEVAVAVKALVAAGQKFAVRSGGHTQWAGSNNIQDGVTIDMSLLDSTIFDSASETVSIGPGARWRHVYDELHKHGRAVAGGRDGNVGVAGLLLGGGLTFFSARMGFACDNVIEYEIVLADGSITYADKERNGDLFVALKGGSNNFGIVTSFKMNAIKSDKIWGGVAILPKQVTPQAVDAFVAFTDNVTNDNDSNLICFFTHSPRLKDIVITPFYANIVGIEKPPAYDKWLSLPEIDNKAKMTSISEMASEYHISAGY